MPEARYDASSITVLAGLEAVRRRPAMYIGSTDETGLHHLAFEVVENAIDEALAGFCTRIHVRLLADGSCAVDDDGRGIPVDPHPSTGRPASEVVLTSLHAGGKFGGGSYKVSGGLHGVGLSCVNALSEWLRLEVRRDGRVWRQSFARGAVTSDLVDAGPVEGASAQGTAVHFLPDPDIFRGGALSFDTLARRLEELAYLHPGVRIRIEDARDGRDDTFENTRGVAGFVEHLNERRRILHAQPVTFAGESGDIRVEIALQWTRDYNEVIRTYVNSIHTPQGGTHLQGLELALTRVVNGYAREERLINPDSEETVAGFDIREGMTAVLSVQMPDPEFDSQTKAKLSSPQLSGLVEGFVLEHFRAFLDAHPDVAAPIVGKAIEASRARAAARRASERAQYVSVHAVASKEVYQRQFGIRSKNWHASAEWIANDELLGRHAAMCKVAPDAKVLDTCCGSGVVGDSFRGRVGHITGLDITPEMVALAKTRLDEVVQGTVYDIPFEDDTFDMVCNREVLHLLPRPEKPVAEMFRVIKPGGQFVVGQILPFSEDDAAWMYRIFKKKQPLLFNMFQEADFRALLSDAGFVDIEMTEYNLWESIDVWIDTHETSSLCRHEIRHLFYNAPKLVRDVHPFEVLPDGQIRDCWRWCIFSAFKPA